MSSAAHYRNLIHTRRQKPFVPLTDFVIALRKIRHLCPYLKIIAVLLTLHSTVEVSL